MSKRGPLLGTALALAALVVLSLLSGCQQQQADAIVTGQAARNVMLQNVEIYNTGNTELVNTIIAPSYVGHHSSMPEPVIGREGFINWIKENRTAFSDFKVTVNAIVVEGNHVCLQWTVTGTNDGPMMNLAPTGKKLSIKGLTLARIQNGLIVEEWITWDQLDMYRQLGVAVPPEA